LKESGNGNAFDMMPVTSGMESGQVADRPIFNILHGEIDMANSIYRPHQALIGKVGELTGQERTWGYFAILVWWEDLFIVWVRGR
jgi:hypothetical protein